MKGSAAVSFALHAGVIALAFVHLGFLDRHDSWGEEGAGGGAATPVTLKGGIPLPPAPVESPLATDTKTLNPPDVQEKPTKAEKAPEPPVSDKAYEIETKKAQKQRERDALLAELKNVQKHPESSAIPGSGARATNQEMSAPVNPTPGSDGIGFGGDFGSKYGWYVRTVRECIARNWDRNRIDTFVRTAPRVYVDFDILRNGTIATTQVATSSGVPAVDREAIRAVQACGGSGTDHLPQLPGDFSGSKVPVEVYFDFKK